MAGFSVALMSKEGEALLDLFCRYYAGLGAEEILVYYDGPIPFAVDPGLSLVRVTECDEAFWRAKGFDGVPQFKTRQRNIGNFARADCRSEWMLLVDTDELLFGDVPVGDFLDRAPADALSIRVPVAEAVYGPGDDMERLFGSTYFRRPMRPKLWALTGRLLYGGTAAFMTRGLVGPIGGKSFFRRPPPDYDVYAHTLKRGGESIDDPRVDRQAAEYLRPGEGLYLGHYDATNFGRWKAKWRLRAEKAAGEVIMRSERARQLEEAIEAIEAGDAAARRVFLRYYGVNALQRLALRAQGLLLRRDVLGG